MILIQTTAKKNDFSKNMNKLCKVRLRTSNMNRIFFTSLVEIHREVNFYKKI